MKLLSAIVFFKSIYFAKITILSDTGTDRMTFILFQLQDGNDSCADLWKEVTLFKYKVALFKTEIGGGG